MSIPADIKPPQSNSDSKKVFDDDITSSSEDLQTIFKPIDPSDLQKPDVLKELVSSLNAEQQTTESFNDIATDGFQDIRQESLNKDIIFNELLRHYSDSFNSKQEQKTKLKSKYFYWIMTLLSVVTLGCFSLPIISVLLKSDNEISIIATIVASLVEFSIAFLKLPKIVAEYLFNKGEDEAMSKIISDMQEYNLKRINRK